MSAEQPTIFKLPELSGQEILYPCRFAGVLQVQMSENKQVFSLIQLRLSDDVGEPIKKVELGSFEVGEAIEEIGWDSGIDYTWLREQIGKSMTLTLLYPESSQLKLVSIFEVKEKNGDIVCKKFPEEMLSV